MATFSIFDKKLMKLHVGFKRGGNIGGGTRQFHMLTNSIIML